MASIGKVVASAFSATNENQFSLVNINADFSLFKIEAPIEYQGLGAALSTRRRENAEQGPLHRTARKLGALFEQIIPPIKTLAEAYGKRVSEISASDKLKSVDIHKGGPFANHVGFDGTSIYAAATSGHSAIAVHLLACLIARTWPTSEATALWVELVTERKREIETNIDVSQIQGMASRIAAQQAISRAELAKWDASARAWLLSADEVKIWEMTQLKLIVKDCRLAVSLRGSTYASVIDVWSVAMTSLQKLILGMPQRISRAALLIGLSAWHIFPDLNVISPIVHVKFHDLLVDDGGILTLGLQSASPDNDAGVQWSLSLSHLRYYGDPVKVSTSAGLENSRISMDDLHIVALGAVLGSWGRSLDDSEAAAECLVALRICYNDGANGTLEVAFPGLEFLCNVAQRFLDTTSSTERENHKMLLSYGSRKGRMFLGIGDRLQPPLFGFCSRMRLDSYSIALSKNSDNEEILISRLRAFALRYGMLVTDSVIVYFVNSEIAFATARPWPDGRSTMHQRWDIKTSTILPRAEYHGEESRFLLPGDVELDYGTGPLHMLCWYSCPLQGKPVRNITFEFVAGDITKAALFYERSRLIETRDSTTDLASYSETANLLRSGQICPPKVEAHFRYNSHSLLAHIRDDEYTMQCSLLMLSVASSLYSHLPGATIPMRLVQIPLYNVKWAEQRFVHVSKAASRSSNRHDHFESFNLGDNQVCDFSKPAQFACIAMFESGTLNLDPDGLSAVMALSSGNSIFVVDSLLQDPSEQETSITRLLGNLGRPGIVMLVPPVAPLVLKAEHDNWQLVNHFAFDGKVEDAFKDTSLHLSFTEYEIPLSVPLGAVDAEATMLETLVSVYDRERWVADIDVLGCLRKSRLFNCLSVQNPERMSSTSISEALERIKEGALNRKQLISIDCWEELLDSPNDLGGSTIAVVRAAKNWSARLAAMCVCVQKGYRTQVLPTSTTLCQDCDQGLEDMINHTKIFIV